MVSEVIVGIRLSPNGKFIHLYFSQIYSEEGWSYSPELAKISWKFRPYLYKPTEQAIVLSTASDTETFIEDRDELSRA